MMQSKPVIGIMPTFNLKNEENDPYQDRASFVRMYIEKVRQCGGIPIGILEDNIESLLPLCDGFIWPGGSKIWKGLYEVIPHAIKYKKPILGICLGSQAIATYFNVIEEQKKYPNKTFDEIYGMHKEEDPYLDLVFDKAHHQHEITKEEESIEKAKHKVKIAKDSMLYSIYQKEEMDVVSLHGYYITKCPKALAVSATSDDGIIEAVEYMEDNNHILGVQFHPEIVSDTKIFEWLIQNTRQKYQILVNKDHHIPDISFDMIEYYSERKMKYLTYQCFKELQTYMKSIGYSLQIESAYRSFEEQEKLYDAILKEKGIEHTLQFVAKPGYSEHETGLSIDVCTCINNTWMYEFDIPEHFYQALHEHCASFGFILRYPKGKENITGYHYEPWHLRFIGNSALAKNIMERNLTLEEFQELCQK